MGLSGRRTIQLRWSLRTPLRRGDKLGLTLCSAGGRTGDPEPETRAGNPVLQGAVDPKEFDSHLEAARALGGIRCGAGVCRAEGTNKGSLGGAWGATNGGRPDRAEGSAAAGDSQWMPPRDPPGLRGAWRGDAPGQGCGGARGKTLRSGRKREEESRAETGSWRGIPGNGGAETASPGALPTLPRPVILAPRSPAGPRYLGSVASPLPSGCQPRAHPLQPDSADAPPHPGSALATPMRAAVGSFRRDLRRRAKASRRGVVVARSLRTRGAPDGSRGLRPERWSKSPALVRAPGCFRIARGRGRQSLYFTACAPWGQNDPLFLSKANRSTSQ
ncbi:collagen alpha-1(II) chain-like [Ovis canadensis]|uniref:collagen alpha-1(II) chain-like n=1 Tax=Ovis canadensis TaxID=37174 RepID=UPI0037516A6E